MHTPDDLDPKRLVLLTLGVGNAFTRRHFNTSFVLFAGGRRILVDAPAPLRRIMADSGHSAGLDFDVLGIHRIILTHLHGDHCNGLEEAGFYRMFVGSDSPKATLNALPEVYGPLWSGRLAAAMDSIAPEGGGPATPKRLDDYFVTEPWDEGEHVVETPHGDLRLRVRRGFHSVPCLGFVAEFNGQSIGYSGDTAFQQEHVEFLSRAQLVIHEAGHGFGHTHVEELATLDPQLLRRTGLVHCPDAWDGEQNGIRLLEEGRLYDPAKGPVPQPVEHFLKK